jgi:oligogalacturonide transport system ATP-binding protein
MPEMNLAEAVLTTDGVPALTLDGQTVRIADGLAGRLATAEGPVTFGVRPQHVEVVPAGTDDSFRGRVSAIEFMGHEVYLHVEIGGQNFIAVVPTERYDRSTKRGDPVALRPIGARVHIFEREGGRNVSLSANHH